MSENIFYINKGEITNKKIIKTAFKDLKDGRYRLKIDNYNKRSLPQNSYYHGVVVPLVKLGLYQAGYDEVKTNEDAHEVIKELFLKKAIANKNTGEFIKLNGSSATLTTLEFAEFIESVVKWGAEFLNIQIPMPNEELLLNL